MNERRKKEDACIRGIREKEKKNKAKGPSRSVLMPSSWRGATRQTIALSTEADAWLTTQQFVLSRGTQRWAKCQPAHGRVTKRGTTTTKATKQEKWAITLLYGAYSTGHTTTPLNARTKTTVRYAQCQCPKNQKQRKQNDKVTSLSNRAHLAQFCE